MGTDNGSMRGCVVSSTIRLRSLDVEWSVCYHTYVQPENQVKREIPIALTVVADRKNNIFISHLFQFILRPGILTDQSVASLGTSIERSTFPVICCCFHLVEIAHSLTPLGLVDLRRNPRHLQRRIQICDRLRIPKRIIEQLRTASNKIHDRVAQTGQICQRCKSQQLKTK